MNVMLVNVAERQRGESASDELAAPQAGTSSTSS